MKMSATSFFILAILLIASFAQERSASGTSCIFTDTHCSCRTIENPGTCLRYQAENSCLVAKCSAAGFTCDCEGEEMCIFTPCNPWVASDGTPSSSLSLGELVDCKSDSSIMCLVPGMPMPSPTPETPSVSAAPASETPSVSAAPASETPSVSAAPASETPSVSAAPASETPSVSAAPSPSPTPEYRMVQFGEASNATMFNMTVMPYVMYIFIYDSDTVNFATSSATFRVVDKYSLLQTALDLYETRTYERFGRIIVQVIDGIVQATPVKIYGDESTRNWDTIKAMVAFGQEYVDSNLQPFIVATKNMQDKWPSPELLRRRHITVRMYNAEGGDGLLLCAMYNTYGIVGISIDPGVSSVAEVRGGSGQAMEWQACDDILSTGECYSDTRDPTYIWVKQYSYATHADGWCAKPLKFDGNDVTLKFKSVTGISGIVFQSGDETERIFMFGEEGNGMTGVVAANGLVTNGEIPMITFNLSGIYVPGSR